MTPQEKAESVLIIIKKLFKWAVVGTLVVVLLFALLLGYLSIQEWFTIDRHKSKIKVELTFNAPDCDKEYPLGVSIKNNSSKTLTNISVDFKVAKKGYSSELNNYSGITSDKILAPNEASGFCYMVESKDSTGFKQKFLKGPDLVVEVTRFYPKFKD